MDQDRPKKSGSFRRGPLVEDPVEVNDCLPNDATEEWDTNKSGKKSSSVKYESDLSIESTRRTGPRTPSSLKPGHLATQPITNDNLSQKEPEEYPSFVKKNVNHLLGKVLGSYRLLSLIGEGGMGQVFEAEHIKLGRKVALKLLRPEYAVKQNAVHRFFQEARAVNTIGHENIVDITDFVQLEDGTTFFIMELLQGKDLGALRRSQKQPIPLNQSMQIALQVCDALQAAHAKGIIHRDLKPDNIFVLDTLDKRVSIKLLDFGVAKLQGVAASHSSYETAAGSVIGTPAYMSPEQASGISVDHRSDIYSLGAIFYELFTGHPVFQAKSFGEFVVKHINEIPIPPRDLKNSPPIPEALEHVILHCLEKNPEDRYQSISQLREDLARATATVETVIRESELKKKTKIPKWALSSLFVVLAILASFVFWIGLEPDKSTLNTVGNLAKEQKIPRGVYPERSEWARDDKTTKIILPKPQVQPLPLQKETAKITIYTQPTGAEVYKEGSSTTLGRTPLSLELENIGETINFIFRLSGYKGTKETVTIINNTVVSVALNPNQPALPDNLVLPSSSKHQFKKPQSLQKKPATPQERPTKIAPYEVVDPFEN